MNVAGIITEFNPLHNGHIIHIEETRKLTGCKYVVAAMSGNFVQRGEPAICDKWLRTKMALQYGVDVVVEIPLPYAISGADYFARGSVGILEAMSVVDALCFGSESGNLAAIETAGCILAEEPEQYKTTLRNGLDKGLSFAAAKGIALEACMENAPDGLLSKPNNVLAIEYCKALRLLESEMKTFTTHRVAGGSSATAIRKGLVDFRNFVPEKVIEVLEGIKSFATIDAYSDIFKYLLYNGCEDAGQMSEGLINRFRKLCGQHTHISALLDEVKTKRYTYTRLQRAVMCTVLGVTPHDMDEYDQNGGVQYVRVLGFRKQAAGLVGYIVQHAKLPVITHGAAMDDILRGGGLAAKMLAHEMRAGDIYKIASGAGGGYRSERGQGIVLV